MMKKLKLNHDVQEGIALLLLGGFLMVHSADAHSASMLRDWAQSPGLFPAAVSLLLAALGVTILRQGLRRSAEETGEGGRPAKAAALMGMCAAYYLALALIRMPYLGVTLFSLTLTFSVFEAATAVFLLAMMLYLGVRRVRTLALAAAGTTAFVSVMFRTLLRVLLP